MSGHAVKGPHGSGHDRDRKALRRVRAPRRRQSPSLPPPPSFGWTAQQKIVMGVLATLLSAWAATGAANAWGMAVPAAFLLLAGGLMAAVGSVWKTVLVWEEMPYGHGVGLHHYYLMPYRVLHSLVIFTNFERYKAPLILMAKGLGLMFLGYLLDSMLGSPPA